jgi:hypothetical protein
LLNIQRHTIGNARRLPDHHTACKRLHCVSCGVVCGSDPSEAGRTLWRSRADTLTQAERGERLIPSAPFSAACPSR